MRAMILAAGLGTRMRPLSDLCAKPALPVRGRPVISLLLSFLARHGVEEVMINLHHRPETVREAVERDRPESLRIEWSEEATPLGTGGGIRRAATFLRGTELCVVLAGDMLLDLDLGGVVARHRASGRDATLVLREDERTSRFGSIGLDEKGRVARLGAPLPGREERAAGLFTGLRIFSREILAHWPSQPVFEDLRDWLVPAILERGAAVGGEILDPAGSTWEPVGTPAEYLHVNLHPPGLPSLGGAADRWSGEVDLAGEQQDVILGRGAALGEGARLERAVVWEAERVPPGLEARSGVFAGGRFHACSDPAAGSPS